VSTVRLRSPSGRSRVALVVVLGAVVALLLAIVVGVLVAGRGHDSKAERELAALQDPDGVALRAARDAARALLSYDYRDLDDDCAAAGTLATASFAQDFTQRCDQARLQALHNEAVVQATPSVTAATAASRPGHLVALVYVDLQVDRRVDQQPQEPEVIQDRVRLTLDEVGGAWLVSRLELL
jgi:Mce-associated membrane protein